MAAQAVERKALIVWEKDGKQTAFVLSETPRVSFTGIKLEVSTSSLIVYFPLVKLQRFTIQPFSFPDALFAPDEAPRDATTLSMDEDALILMGVPAKAPVQVYTLSGLLVPVPAVRAEDSVRIPLSSLPAGTYIITAGDRSFKVIR
jgi:hypothetical protein